MKRNVSKVLSVLLIAALMLSFTAVASAETRMYATRAVNEIGRASCRERV